MVACLEKSEGNADFHEIFWNTAHSQTVNDVKQIHATVDGKTVVISKSSVRSDLYFNDEDGITCLTNDAIFENLALMGYESNSNKLTFQKALFSPQYLVIKKLKKKVRKLEKKLRARTPGLNLFKIGTSKRKSLDKENNVEGDAETQGRNTAEQITTAGDTVNTTSIDVNAVGPSNVSTSFIVSRTSILTARDIFKDKMMTIADTLVAIRSTIPRTTSVVIRDVEEEPRRATPVPTIQIQDKGKGKMVEPEPTLKNPIKTQIQRDAEIAQKLFEEEQAQFERDSKGLLGKKLQNKRPRMLHEFKQRRYSSKEDANELLVERLQQEERE
ncbi:hypothetical protein Tco_0282017 [Tanacetum coccineum]